MAEPKVPTNAAEAEAVEKTLAQFRLNRLNEVKNVLTGPNATAFMAEINTLLSDGIPPATSAKGHVEQLPGWITQVLAGLDVDIKQVELIINPPPAAPVVTPQPVSLTASLPVPTA